jgi:hypothetical protein
MVVPEDAYHLVSMPFSTGRGWVDIDERWFRVRTFHRCLELYGVRMNVDGPQMLEQDGKRAKRSGSSRESIYDRVDRRKEVKNLES